MEACDKLEGIIEELKSSESKNLEKLEELEKELKKRRTKNIEGLLRKIDASEAGKMLEVIQKLSECFEYTNLGYKNEDYPKPCVDLSAQQFDKILEISKIEGDVFSVIEALSYIGYSLILHREKRYIDGSDVKLFKELTENNFSDEKKVVLKSMKDMLGYTFCKINEGHQKIITIAKMKGDVLGAVYLLANKGCKINQKTGLSKEYLKAMQGIAKELKKMGRSGGSYSYMYGNVKPDIFKKYFSNLSMERKKAALKKILESDRHNEEVTKWLEKDYNGLLREASFED